MGSLIFPTTAAQAAEEDCTGAALSESRLYQELTYDDDSGIIDELTYHIEDIEDYAFPGFIESVNNAFGAPATPVPPHIAAFISTDFPNLWQSYKTAASVFIDKAQAGDATATDMQELLSAMYDYKLGLYNDFAAAWNADQAYTLVDPYSYDVSDMLYYLRVMSVDSTTSYATAPNQLLSSIGDSSADISSIQSEFHALYQDLQTSMPKEEARRLAVSAMREAVERWVKQMDIEYFTAYQAQVNQYLSTLRDARFVYDLDAPNQWDTIVLDVGQPRTRGLRMTDLPYLSTLELNPDFFDLMLDSDNRFLTPEAMYDSSAIQAMVTAVMGPIDGLLDEDAYYDENTFSDDDFEYEMWSMTGESIANQYGAMYAAGGYGQPVSYVMSELIDTLGNEYLAALQRNPQMEMPLLANWKDDAVVPGELPYDTYRVKNYLSAPSLLTGQATRDINYVFEDGTAAAPSVSESPLPYRCIGNKAYYTNGNDTFPAVVYPATVTYPGDDVKVLDPVTTTAGGALASTVTVTYPLEFTVNVSFVDEDGVDISAPGSLTGRWGTDFTAQAATVDGYTLTSSEASVPGVFGTDRDGVVFVYAKASPQTPTSVVPTAPERVAAPKCGVEATVTVPQTTGVVYTTGREGNRITVTATAAQNYVIADGATTTWVFDVTPDKCATAAGNLPSSLVKTGGDGALLAGISLLAVSTIAIGIFLRRKAR